MDQNPNPLGPMAQQLATAFARHALSVAAGFLAADGVISSDQSDSFVKLGLSVFTFAVSYGLSVWQKRFARGVVVQAAAASSHAVAP